MSAFMQGLTAGSNVASSWMDTYERSRRRKEEQDLKARREGIISAQPEDAGMRYSPEQGAELERVAQSGQYDIGYDQARGAYTVTPKGLGAEQVSPEPSTYAPTQRYGSFLGQEYEGEMTPERAQGLRNRAMLDTVVDPFERQRLELTQMQTEEVQGKREREAATRAAQAQLQERLGRGEILDAPAILAMAGEGVDSTALMQTAAAALELDSKQIKASTDKLISQINKASTSPEKFNEVLRQFDPDPNDDRVPTLRTNRDGTLQVFLGDEPLTQKFRDTKDMSALSQLAGFYKDQITGDRMGTAVQMATLEKLRAQTRASEAGAFKDRQVGLAAGAEKAPRQATIAELNTMAKGMIDSGMEDPDEPGKPLPYTKALAIARSEAAGIPYKSAADKLVEQAIAARQKQEEEDRKKKEGGGATTTTTTPGLTREQIGQAVTQQQTGVQAETRVRRAAITAFEQDPRVRQAYDAVRQLRRSGEAVRANDIENQINAQRERFIAERVGGGR